MRAGSIELGGGTRASFQVERAKSKVSKGTMDTEDDWRQQTEGNAGG